MEGSQQPLKTMAVRVPEQLHAQCVLLAKLAKRSLADELILAVTTHVAARWTEADVKAHAEEALAEIDREATSRRKAISQLLADSPAAGGQAKKARRS